MATTTSDDEAAMRDVIDRAFRARHEGRFDDALSLCKEALAALPADQSRRRAIVHGEMGYIYWTKVGDLVTAAEHFRESVRLAPSAELPSLGLFHTLMAMGCADDALHEAVRFVSLKDSTEYRELLNGGGFGADLPDAALALANEARARLDRWS